MTRARTPIHTSRSFPPAGASSRQRDRVARLRTPGSHLTSASSSRRRSRAPEPCWQPLAPRSKTLKINLLIVDHDREKFRIMTEEVARVWGDDKPAMTLIPIPALALEGMLVEIDVIAVVPND